jgi:hypothetical protein
VDGRSLIARRYRDIVAAILVGQSGADQCSEARLQLIRRFAAAVLAEQMEARLARGETICIAEHALLVSTMTRNASWIGIERKPRDVSLSPGESSPGPADGVGTPCPGRPNVRFSPIASIFHAAVHDSA